jgi:hypothetical protein
MERAIVLSGLKTKVKAGTRLALPREMEELYPGYAALVMQMIHEHPEERPSTEDILNHPLLCNRSTLSIYWTHGTTSSAASLPAKKLANANDAPLPKVKSMLTHRFLSTSCLMNSNEPKFDAIQSATPRFESPGEPESPLCTNLHCLRRWSSADVLASPSNGTGYFSIFPSDPSVKTSSADKNVHAGVSSLPPCLHEPSSMPSPISMPQPMDFAISEGEKDEGDKDVEAELLMAKKRIEELEAQVAEMKMALDQMRRRGYTDDVDLFVASP